MLSFKEEEFFAEMLTYVDQVQVAKDIIKQSNRSQPEYWDQMAVICKEKARRLKNDSQSK